MCHHGTMCYLRLIRTNGYLSMGAKVIPNLSQQGFFTKRHLSEFPWATKIKTKTAVPTSLEYAYVRTSRTVGHHALVKMSSHMNVVSPLGYDK